MKHIISFNEKSKSKSQQRLMGWSLACLKGKQKKCPTNIMDIGKSFTKKDSKKGIKSLKDFAKTKHLGLPEKVSKSKSNESVLSYDEFINEEFIGKALKNIFNKLKNKASLKISKSIGSAKEIDKLIEKYKESYIKSTEQKNEAEKLLITYEKGIIEGSEVDENKRKELINNLKKLKGAVNNVKDTLKKKFDSQFSNILKNESDDRVKDYIKLKKLEMAEEIAAEELRIIQEDMGVSDEDRKKSKVLNQLTLDYETSLSELTKSVESVTELLSKENEEEEIEYKEGDDIIYFKSDDEDKKDPKKAKVMKQEVDGEKVEGDRLRVSTESAPGGFTIGKDQIKVEKEEKNSEEEEDLEL